MLSGTKIISRPPSEIQVQQQIIRLSDEIYYADRTMQYTICAGTTPKIIHL